MARVAFESVWMNEPSSDVEIVDFEPDLAADFERLNREWLEALFRVEPVDAKVLGDPEHYVIEPGGHILMARLGQDVVGTVALKHEGDGRFELTKMAVTVSIQGRGVGRLLGEAAVERFRSVGGRFLYLAPALTLYESLGFRHSPRPAPSDYERSDVYMVFES